MKRINPYKYHGSLQSCSSKSHAQRILILGALSRKDVFIKNFFETEIGQDVHHVMIACKQLGYTFKADHLGTQMIAPKSLPDSGTEFLIGESGFALRTLSTVLSFFLDNYTLRGHKTLLKRNHEGLIHSLKAIGFDVLSNDGGLPLMVSLNKEIPSSIQLNGGEGSQFISGLLMLSPFLKKDINIKVKDLTSRPYIDLTIDSIKQFNGIIISNGYSDFTIPGVQKIQAKDIALEGDWSNMAFHLVGAALSGEIVVDGLFMNSSQADKLILSVIEKFGAIIEWESKAVKVIQAKMNPFEIDLTDAPDLFPVLAVLASGAKGVSSLLGTNRLLNKESNRLQSICEMLEVFKVNFKLDGNALLIEGTGSIQGGTIKTYDDHRMAMAAICAGTISKTPITIENEKCIQKSYRNYFQQMDSILANDS